LGKRRCEERRNRQGYKSNLTSVLYQEIPTQKLERTNLCDKLPPLLRE
jgi:hypothetical protein